jgi:hypothetical protein
MFSHARKSPQRYGFAHFVLILIKTLKIIYGIQDKHINAKAERYGVYPDPPATK